MEVKEVIRKACHTLMPRLQTFLRFRKVSGKHKVALWSWWVLWVRYAGYGEHTYYVSASETTIVCLKEAVVYKIKIFLSRFVTAREEVTHGQMIYFCFDALN